MYHRRCNVLDFDVVVDRVQSSCVVVLLLLAVRLTRGFARQCRWHLGTRAGLERRLALSSYCQYMYLLGEVCRHRCLPGETLVGDDNGTVGCVLNAATGSTIMAAECDGGSVCVGECVVRKMRGDGDVAEEEKEAWEGCTGNSKAGRCWHRARSTCTCTYHRLILVGVGRCCPD